MSNITKLLIVLVFSNIFFCNVRGTEPNPPVFPASVKVIEPGDATAQSVIDQVYAQNGGHVPACNGQFSENRYALLFKPGQHNLKVNVGYYTSVMGLGNQPQDTQIQSVTCENGDYTPSVGALNNFWRSAENFYTRPTETYNNVGNSMLWAVSQASPLRRVVIDGNLQLYQYNQGDYAGYASGGYMADVTVNGATFAGSQQQFIIRNSRLASWQGNVWNYVFVGTQGAPGQQCNEQSKVTANTNIAQTPVIAEKPFIVFENGKYYLAVPNLEMNKVGPSNYPSNFQKVGFEQVYVSQSTDSAATINAKLAQGLHILFTPGNYNLQDSIVVTNPNTILLGIGMATLISTTGKPCVVVNNVDGVRVAGLLLQAGTLQTPSLLQWGTGAYAGTASNPGFIQDVFVRVGGPNDPNQQQVTADKMFLINSGNVIIDDTWLWRADHGVVGQTKNSQNPVQTGIQVNGDNVIAYGLAVEHTLSNLVEWNGQNGQVYFFQAEYPYDVTQANYGDKKYVAYKVADNVSSHKAYGVGVYSYFAFENVVVDNGIQTPLTNGIQFTNCLTVFLNGGGQITHVINGQGNTSVGPTFMLNYKCSYIGGQQSTSKFLEIQ